MVLPPNVRTEGLGLRAAGCSFGKSHDTILVEGLQRALNAQRLIHHWVRSRKQTTPAMTMGYCERSLSIHELPTLKGFQAITS